MNRLFSLTPAVFALVAISWSQAPSDSTKATDLDATSSAHHSAALDSLTAGTVISAELWKRLDVKKFKANDKIEARTVRDLLVQGRIVVPRNTKIIGHVAEVRTHSKTSPGSMVGIVLDRMLLKDGREIPLIMTILAIARPLHTAAYGSGPDTLADKSTTPRGLPPVGAQAPATGSSSLTPDYPDNIPAPPSINTGRPGNATVGPLDSRSRGVFGIKGLSLDSSGPVSVLSSSTGNLDLDSGTQLTLRVQ